MNLKRRRSAGRPIKTKHRNVPTSLIIHPGKNPKQLAQENGNYEATVATSAINKARSGTGSIPIYSGKNFPPDEYMYQKNAPRKLRTCACTFN
jgi:hypothetical protein